MVEKYMKNIKYCFNTYKVVGIYRPNDVHIGHKIYGFISRLFFIDLLLILLTMYFTHVKNIIEFADLLSMQLTWLAIASKSYIVINRFKVIENLINELRELLEFANEYQIHFGEHIMKRMHKIRRVFIIYWSSCPFNIIMGFMSAMMDAKDPPYKIQYRFHPPSFFNFEENYSYFVITGVFELIGSIFAATTAVSMDFLAVFFFSMGAGLLEELAERVSQIETELNANLNDKNQLNIHEIKKNHEDMADKELKRCIEIHARIKKFLVSAQNMVSPIIFVQIVISSVIICMTCYTISMPVGAAVLFRQITYMIPMGLQIYIPCYFGNEIMIAAEKFSMDIFHTKWYQGCKKLRNSFKIILTHSAKPMIMICGMIFQVTLENFVNVCQLSYKFYAVMQNMNANEVLEIMNFEE